MVAHGLTLKEAGTIVAEVFAKAGWTGRDVPVLGTNAEFALVRRLEMGAGEFLPTGDLDQGHGRATGQVDDDRVALVLG